MTKQIIIDGVTYVPENQAPKGPRAVVVLDRGWIFAGDVTEENGRILISRAVAVRRWESIGFEGMVADPKKAKAVINPVADVDCPASSELFRVPVADNWGL